MIALIDGDIVRYRTGFASNDVDERIALWRANETMEQILRAVGATEYRVYLSDNKDNNYRYKLFPGYKATREKQAKPTHHEALKDFLIYEWGAVVSQGQEADDALGIDQTTVGDGSVICSIDKDLLQVPGKHFNWVRNEFQEQTYLSGVRCFYEQCLKGDRTDDISGIKGIGEVKARRILQGAETEIDMFNIVRGMWQDDEALLMTGRLLWVRRYEGEMWEFPSTTQDTEPKSQSSSTMQEGTDHFSERGTQEKNGAPEAGTPTEDTSTVNSRDWIS